MGAQRDARAPVAARRRGSGALLGALLVALGVLAGCAERPADPPGDGRQVVDASLFSFLSKARAAHHQADLAVGAGDTAAAIEHVARITTGPRPAASPEVIEVLADAHARLADLRSAAGRFDDAAAEIDAGLALATEITHFRGHLFEVRGVVEERRMKQLRSDGDVAGADAARERALDAFEAAIEVQDQVIERALSRTGKPGAPAPSSSAAPPR